MKQAKLSRILSRMEDLARRSQIIIDRAADRGKPFELKEPERKTVDRMIAEYATLRADFERQGGARIEPHTSEIEAIWNERHAEIEGIMASARNRRPPHYTKQEMERIDHLIDDMDRIFDDRRRHRTGAVTQTAAIARNVAVGY